ncbi:MAG: trigger factor [Venatoribacter sp.]
MQVSVETTSGLERVMTISVPAADFENVVNSELKRVAKSQKVNGFRKGKALPANVAKRMFGKQARFEAMYAQMQQSFFEAIQKQQFKIAGMPAFEPTVNEEGKDLEFKATFEVYPEVVVGDFSAIEVEQKTAEITDADINTMLDNLRKQSATWNESAEAAADGDQVVIDFEGFIDGEAFEGGSAQGYSLTLGSKSMIPGFEEALVGVKAGEERTLDVSFPEDYHKEELKGKAAQFKTKTSAVKKAQLPELTEEFFKKFGVEAKDEAEFRTEVRKNMERELARALRAITKQQVVDGLIANNSIDVPSALIDQEIDRLRQQAVQQFGGAQYMDPNRLPAELFKDQAQKRVQIGLLMNAIVEANEIKASEEKVNALIEEVAATYQDPEEVRNFYATNAQQKAQVEALAIEEQVVEKVLAGAKVSQASASYEDVIKAANQPA